jgi:hypothetical protein
MADPNNAFPYLVNTEGLPNPYPAGPRFAHDCTSKRPKPVRNDLKDSDFDKPKQES